ncbi:MAG: type IV secretory system conjugative DNA transfer family protein [Coriobacteriia bacterium]|nr:type IV secretory system conjugative DNA transfer family protein [Coriobacteriia bacterium]MCL2871206.1 type IV secretory system conjugative DNA transfer family protein [Coriobacteriia bacterium]
MKKLKSYNKPPNPMRSFTVCFVLLGTIAAGSVVVISYFAPHWIEWTKEQIAILMGYISLDIALTSEVVLFAALAILVLGLAVSLTCQYMDGFHNGVWLGEKPSRSKLHGSSRLLSRPRDLKRAFKVWKKGKKPKVGLVVGGIGANRSKLLYDEIIHALVLGGTGSGKTTSCLIPTIAQLIESETSGIVLDPKGECFAVTGQKAIDTGFKTVCIDFSSSRTSDGWNPLQPALDCAREVNGRERQDLASEIRIISSNLIPESSASSPIWTQAARILFSGICAFVVESEDIPKDMKNLSTVAALAALSKEDLCDIVKRLSFKSHAKHILKPLLEAPDETYGGFQMNLNTALSIYADPSISGMLAHSGISVEDFLEGKCMVYVRFNSSGKAYDALLAAFVNQMIDGLRRLAESRCNGTLPAPIFFILEEFPQMPKIDDLAKHISVIRSQGMHLVIAAQDRSQIKAVYGKDAPAILNNLATTLFLAASDKEEPKHLEETLGSYTVELKTRSNTRGANNGSTTESVSYQESKLFRAADLAKWGYEIGHLVVKNGQAYACSSLPVSKTFVGDALGLGGVEADADKQAEMKPKRPIINPEPAKAWRWNDSQKDKAIGDIARALETIDDPRYM